MSTYLTTPAPLWATVLLVLLAFASGRWFHRAKLVQAKQAAERAAGRAIGRQAVREEMAAVAAERALEAEASAESWPEPVSRTLTTRGGSILEDAGCGGAGRAKVRRGAARRGVARFGMDGPAASSSDDAAGPLPAADPPDNLDRRAVQADATALRGDFRRAAADFPALSPDARAEARQETTQLLADLRHTDELVEASSLGTAEAAELRGSVSPRGELTGVPEEQADWDEGDPFDMEPEPDEDLPQDETRATRYGSGLYGEVAALVPRYGWPATGWSPGSPTTVLERPVPGVLPRGYDWLARLLVAAGGWLRRVLAYPVQRWEAAKFAPADESPWAEGELAEETGVLPAVGRAVVRRELPRSYLPVHVWGRGLRMVSAAAVLGGVTRTGQAGRHRDDVAVGALGQRRDIRLFALPAGAR